MKVRLYMFLAILPAIMFLCSCRYQENPQYPSFYGTPLNIVEFVEMRAKWKELNIKNYEFTYDFDDNMHLRSPYYIECRGDVVVKNGVGTVTFYTTPNGSWMTPNKDDPYEKKFYITSIEDVFDNILDDYLRLKRMKEEGKVENIWVRGSVWYDRDYFYLKHIGYSIDPSIFRSAGPRNAVFRIKKFKVTE